VFGVVSVPRLVAIALLVVFAPLAMSLSPLVIGLVATLVVVGVAVHETVFHPAVDQDSITVEGA
jgi:hypothetical protein